jgi:hypothetical protein
MYLCLDGNIGLPVSFFFIVVEFAAARMIHYMDSTLSMETKISDV